MDMVKTNNFTELTTCEMQYTDGGIVLFGVAVTLSFGAKVALGLFGAGTVVGVVYGIVS